MLCVCLCAKVLSCGQLFLDIFLFGVSTFFNFFNPHVTFIFLYLSLSLSLSRFEDEEREKERENRLSLKRLDLNFSLSLFFTSRSLSYDLSFFAREKERESFLLTL